MDKTRSRKTTSLTRRQALATALGGAALAAGGLGAQAQVASPAIRKKVKLTFWNWADNPVHQKISVDSVAMFNASQNFIEMEVDANMAVMEARKKLVVSYAAGAAPDVVMTIQYWVQDYFENGLLEPIEDRFNKWDEKADFFPNIMEQTRSRAGQPFLFVPQTSIPYFLFYRADWFKAAGLTPPDTYDQFIAAAKALTKAPDRYGFAMRGQTASAIQVIFPIWASAGVKFATPDGKVDFDSPAAIEVTDKWLGMALRDKSAQPTAVNDGYRELYALMEKGRCAMWYYGPHASPALISALGDAIQGVQNPRVGEKHHMIANPEGPMMVSSCKEKEAAWEFMKFITSGDAAMLFTANRMVPPVRKTLSQRPVFQNNRFIKMSLDHLDTWWTPPYDHQHWTNFQDKIPPYWQEAVRGNITAAQFNQQGAKFLRGEA
ncbi:extracellular solute-binding protein [Bosea caraganae]|uniref:Extracellular solute-binding protein n=1 Tax=Bosea caraganae TaxID=2763117 RepID=A0A370LAQ3_9HYPH|nr:extracellular solute-binding protein [Bosea caraganae]RDJ21688.1 extracellular solute-binding protein [Bosea caraganae]RDJ28281.1 extracellular solute-binding protein [Bosea caraganae]